MELGQHKTSARALLSVDVECFVVVGRSQREYDEEDEVRILDVLSRTLGDQEKASVNANQLLG